MFSPVLRETTRGSETHITLQVLSQPASQEANAQWIRLWPAQDKPNATLWEFCPCLGSQMTFSGPQISILFESTDLFGATGSQHYPFWDHCPHEGERSAHEACALQTLFK